MLKMPSTASTKTILQAPQTHLPETYPFVWDCYLNISLFDGESCLYSASGVQQGDPFIPALFVLTIDEVTSNVKSDLMFGTLMMDELLTGAVLSSIKVWGPNILQQWPNCNSRATCGSLSFANNYIFVFCFYCKV